ncbi:Transcription elongation factor SPT5 [Anas platyrhynchos]|uniref:Transcription elongation factor SPT5 n=1 Tax=Anas platyrhynchos TaxID=8839 RepID=R0J9Y7_ANAPL|nr:Transcription elongation factor SPT5 [Anas platyrhynchos]
MKKYAKSSVGETVYGGSDELSDDITQQQLLPGVKDPNLWTVKCKITEGVKPTLSELEKFEDQPEGIDLEVVTESTGKEREHNFQPGDNVEVCEGELINLQGKILSVDGNKITIMPKHEDLKHEWGELVQLDPQTVGVIVRLERETFQVLNMYGKVVTVRHQAVTRKKDNRFAVALDSEQNNIHVKDIVKVIDGPHSGREGEIRHLFRGFAFLHCKKLVENGGIPMTPGAPSPGGYNPHTPGSGIEQSSSDWVTTDIQVKVRDTYLDSQAVGQTGIIRSVTGGMCSVYLKDSEKVVKVILGEDREATGILLSIDGEDGIVRMDLDEQLKILNLRFLGKLLEA